MVLPLIYSGFRDVICSLKRQARNFWSLWGVPCHRVATGWGNLVDPESRLALSHGFLRPMDFTERINQGRHDSFKNQTTRHPGTAGGVQREPYSPVLGNGGGLGRGGLSLSCYVQRPLSTRQLASKHGNVSPIGIVPSMDRSQEPSRVLSMLLRPPDGYKIEMRL